MPTKFIDTGWKTWFMVTLDHFRYGIVNISGSNVSRGHADAIMLARQRARNNKNFRHASYTDSLLFGNNGDCTIDQGN